MSSFQNNPEASPQGTSGTEPVEAVISVERLQDWHGEMAGYHKECIHQIIEEYARTSPEAMAVIDDARRVSYWELNNKANKLAHRLRTSGVGPDVLVGVCMDRSIEAVVALVAILKAGGAYLPVDPDLPQHYLETILQDAHVSLVVTTVQFESVLPVGHLSTICVDAFLADADDDDCADLDSETTPDNLAYVLYTSGSTGEPKGVLGIHRSLTNGLVWNIPFTRDDVFGFRASLSFGGALSLFGVLGSGATLAIIRDEQLNDPGQMVAALEDLGVTRVNLTPLLRTLLTLGPKLASRLPKLRMVGIGGTAVTQELRASFVEILPSVRLFEYYTSTEIGAAAIFMNEDSTSRGRAVANARVYVLDERMRPAPIGVVGELYLGGAHLARGYLGRPDLTAQYFLEDPFDPRDGAKIFRTGDLACYLPNGEIELHGRADHQIKLRGFRIELSEIEAEVLRHSDVHDAVVTTQDIGTEKRLVAYVVPASNVSMSVSAIRQHLAAHLPSYMIPSVILVLSSLPTTKTGKVDRAALPLAGRDRPDLDNVYEEPRSDVEVAITQIWEELLRLDKIGIHDHFLELGGDSLTAMEVMARISEHFGLDVALPALFAEPTVAGLAAAVTRQPREASILPNRVPLL